MSCMPGWTHGSDTGADCEHDHSGKLFLCRQGGPREKARTGEGPAGPCAPQAHGGPERRGHRRAAAHRCPGARCSRPTPPAEIDSKSVLTPPGRAHLFGTDNLGRDVFSRVVYGARHSLYVGLASVALGSIGGGLVGLVSGYRGGSTDAVAQRLVDALMAFPTLILALTIVAALGASLSNVIGAVAIAQAPWVSRVVRATTLSTRELQHVEAARALGCSDFRIIAVHVAPQCLGPFLVVATAALGAAIITEASLSFLGLGVPPPAPSWGGMLSGATRDYARAAPWMAIAPGAAISMAVYSFNLLGDTLRDELDPRQRGL